MRHPPGISLHLDVITSPPSVVSISRSAQCADRRSKRLDGGALPKSAILLHVLAGKVCAFITCDTSTGVACADVGHVATDRRRQERRHYTYEVEAACASCALVCYHSL